jgi:hypothetical protein
MRAGSFLLTVAFAIALFPSHTRAQAPVRPFDRVDVGLYGAANVNRNQFHAYWDAGRAGAIDAVTPFYAGRVSLLVRVTVNDAATGETTPEFTSVFAALGWRVGRPLFFEHLRTDLGLHVGFTEWIFDAEDESPRRRARAGRRGQRSRRLRVRVALARGGKASYQYTFTYERIELGYVSVGVARTFAAPGWIRSVLQ